MTTVAILGASGFGRFHAREFHRAGAEVRSLLGSSPKSAAATSDRLRADFGVEARPFAALDELLATPHDVIVVCTPHEMHREHLLAALATDAFVLCEKPLFWNDGLTAADAEATLDELARAGARERLGLNTLNVHSVDELARRGRLPEAPTRFAFRFHTQGRFEAEAIAVDLLPHALSLLGRLAPGGTPRDVRATFERHRATFAFAWGELACELDLREDPCGEKLLEWTLDDVAFRREGAVVDGRYRVGVREFDVAEPHAMDDPLEWMVRGFLEFARGEGPCPVGFDEAAAIQRATSALL